MLAELQKLLQAEATLEEKERQLADVSQQIQKIEKVAAKYVWHDYDCDVATLLWTALAKDLTDGICHWLTLDKWHLWNPQLV